MSGGKLEVQIGADKTDFDKKIKEVEFDIKELSKVKLDRLKLGLDTTEINKNIRSAKDSLSTLKATAENTGNAFSKTLAPKVANGGNALMQFSRIAQDAPFGIMGIGNNITATAEAFGNLKNSTGSTGAALKAVASSIMGTGGILLGVSLLTTGLTLMAQSGLTVGDVINKLTGNFDEYGATLKKISIDSAKNSGQEIAGLKALISVAQDDVKSREDRLTAVDELQSKYPGYFGNLTKEQILTGDLTAVTKELSKAIIARAEASAIADKIGELAAKKLDLQIQKEKEILALQKTQANVKQANDNLKTAQNIAGAGQRAAGAAGAYALATARVKDLNEQILVIQTQQDKLAGRLNDKTSESIKLLEKKDKLTKETKVFNTPQVSVIGSDLNPKGRVLPPIIVPAADTTAFGNSIPVMSALMQDFLLMWSEFGITFNQIIEQGIEQSLIGFGEAIGNSIINGANILQAAGASLLGTLGQMISSVGKEMVKMGVLAQAYAAVITWMKKAFANPYALAAAGVALVIIGAAVSASASRIGSGGSGSGSSASASTGSGANNSSFSSSGFSSNNNGGTVVFEIAGQKLIGVLSNTINANKRLGGAIGLG